MIEYSMTDIAPTVSAILGIPVPAQAKGKPIPRVVADLAGSAKIALLAPDAFGLYAFNLWRAEMPYLASLHAQRSIVLRSAMPSITPVNFACMVTGTDQAGHGVHTREDPFACETLFEVLRRSGGRSAGIGLNDYTGCRLLARHADIAGCVDDGGSDDDIADAILRIAHNDGPQFLIAQLGRVDDVFHLYGPSSPSVVPMLRGTDARLKRLIEELKLLGFGVIQLADHGQHDLSTPTDKGHYGTHGSDADKDCQVPCTWI
jgi:hypothetical protein